MCFFNTLLRCFLHEKPCRQIAEVKPFSPTVGDGCLLLMLVKLLPVPGQAFFCLRTKSIRVTTSTAVILRSSPQGPQDLFSAPS